MDFLLPIAASFLQAASFTVDKTVLKLRHVTYKVYTGISFPLLVVIDFAIFVVVRPPLPVGAFSNSNLLLLLLVVVIAIGTNVIFYRALHDDTLGEIQTISLLTGFPVILLSSAVFASERNLPVIAAALAAALAVLWSHWKNHHFRVAKKTLPYLFWALAVFPFSSLINKELLYTWNPILLELVRDVGVAAVLGPLFWKQSKKIKGRAWGLLLVTNIFTGTAFIFQGFSIQRSGIVFTALVFSLLPLLTYFSSVFLLKEKYQWKKSVAFAVVLGSILIAKLLG